MICGIIDEQKPPRGANHREHGKYLLGGIHMQDYTTDSAPLYKTCSQCCINQPLENYYRSKENVDGHRHDCKRCVGFRTSKYRREHPGSGILSAKIWKGNHHDKIKVVSERYRRLHPQAVECARLVRVNVLGNRLAKPNICSCCGHSFEIRHIHGHHRDYSKPLDVTWLCHWCHIALHRGTKSSQQKC
jgi:hypothetical protein